jgi:hypothetical protein
MYGGVPITVPTAVNESSDREPVPPSQAAGFCRFAGR